jgi:hypothetical protein
MALHRIESFDGNSASAIKTRKIHGKTTKFTKWGLSNWNALAIFKITSVEVRFRIQS